MLPLRPRLDRSALDHHAGRAPTGAGPAAAAPVAPAAGAPTGAASFAADTATVRPPETEASVTALTPLRPVPQSVAGAAPPRSFTPGNVGSEPRGTRPPLAHPAPAGPAAFDTAAAAAGRALTVQVPSQRASDAPPAARPDDLEAPPNAPGEPQNRRVRVVLAERKGTARPVRTVVDIQEGTGVGELLRSNLISSQLAVALRFAVGAGLTLGLLPLLFAVFPEIGHIDVLGLRLPWLLLGFLVYPFLLGVGWWHTRTAERVEQDFADHVQD